MAIIKLMPRVLTTQSHVVHGYVGNKAATFPLQCVGWDVDCVNSVQFSNHTGYGMDNLFGTVTDKCKMDALFKGLWEFKYDYNAILSGYLPNKESVKCMGYHYSMMKDFNPSLLWILDPVIGDEGQLYVDEDVIPEYKNLVRSGRVDAITPNQFELEILYGQKIENLNQMREALIEIHKTVPIIIITSCSITLFNDPNNIFCVASFRGKDCLIYKIPMFDSYFTGVGDLFSAWLLHRLYYMYLNETNTFSQEINKVLNLIHKVLKRTLDLSQNRIKSTIGCAQTMKEMELRIIDSLDCYETNNIDIDFIYEDLKL